MKRSLTTLLIIVFTACMWTACGSYVPVMEGSCKEGRTWVPPSKDADGNWNKDANGKIIPGRCE